MKKFLLGLLVASIAFISAPVVQACNYGVGVASYAAYSYAPVQFSTVQVLVQRPTYAVATVTAPAVCAPTVVSAPALVTDVPCVCQPTVAFAAPVYGYSNFGFAYGSVGFNRFVNVNVNRFVNVRAANTFVAVRRFNAVSSVNVNVSAVRNVGGSRLIDRIRTRRLAVTGARLATPIRRR